MAVQLPDELIVEILSIIPAKSLLRFRLVCKCWLNLISSTKFNLMHLHNFNQLNPRYFVRRLDFYASEEWFRVHLDNEAFTSDRGTQIEFPFDDVRVNICFRIVGCCNGVVCLCDDDDVTKEAFSLDAIILWNPSIRRKLTLPLPIFHSVGFEYPYVVLGFGYDRMSDDYKVVSLTYDERSSASRPHVEVYTLKTGIWRKVMFPDNLRCFNVDYNLSPIFSNGSVHWIACDPTSGVSHDSILTFDIGTELFDEIQLPEILAEESLMVSVVGESLAVMHSSDLYGLKSGSTYTVMVMKEYKNPTSWTMIYCMQYTEVAMGKPLRLRNNGDMIVELEKGDTVMFNHIEGYYVYVFRGCMDEDFDYIDDRTYVDRYEESLALLDVGDSVPNKDAVKALMMIEKQGADVQKMIPIHLNWLGLILWLFIHSRMKNNLLKLMCIVKLFFIVQQRRQA